MNQKFIKPPCNCGIERPSLYEVEDGPTVNSIAEKQAVRSEGGISLSL